MYQDDDHQIENLSNFPNKLTDIQIKRISNYSTKSRSHSESRNHNHSSDRDNETKIIHQNENNSNCGSSDVHKIKSRIFKNNAKSNNSRKSSKSSVAGSIKSSSSRRHHSVSSHKMPRHGNEYSQENSLSVERRRVKRKIPLSQYGASSINQETPSHSNNNSEINITSHASPNKNGIHIIIKNTPEEVAKTLSTLHFKKVRGDSVGRKFKARSIKPENSDISYIKRSPKINTMSDKLQMEESLTLDHYYIQPKPQPLLGELVSLLNGTKNKSNIKKEEELQYVTPYRFIPGPTAPRQNRHNHKRNKYEAGSNKQDINIGDLFLDDDTELRFFTLDFGTNYVESIEDEITLYENAISLFSPNFFSLEFIPSHLVEKLRQQEVVTQVLRMIFDSRVPPKKSNGFNLTNVMVPNENEVKYYTVNKIVYIDCISPSAFFDFKFGKNATEQVPDRFHLFVWHNLGIPPLPMAKNVVKALKSLPPENMSNIAQYVFLWLYYYPQDFYDDINCSELLLKMTKKMVNKNTDLVLCQAAIIRALVLSLKNKTHSPEEFRLKYPSPNMKNNIHFNDLMDLEIDPNVLVNHFTYIDIEMLHKLNRIEFVHDNWKTRPDLSPNVNAMIERFNEISSFIASSILVDDLKQRAKIIMYWIRVMEISYKIKNYHLIAEIDAALNCLPIKRLKSTWKSINQSSKEKYEKFRNFFDNKKYKDEMIESPEITMPFIGLFLSELSHVFDEEPLKKPLSFGSEGYNMGFHRKCFSIIENLFIDWGIGLRFELDTKLLEECRVLSGRARRSEDLIIPSVNFESPRPNEKKFIESYLRH